MAFEGTNAELDHARRRARAGLWMGPGFLVIASMAVAIVTALWGDGSRMAGRGMMLMVMMVSALLHLGCFLEFVLVVRWLGHRPLPPAVLMLLGYWILLAMILVAAAFAG